MDNEVAVISLTYNRPEYIEQSFQSLYEKTERDFDHYVFDDNSNAETIEVLKQLQSEYGFYLTSWKSRLNIAKSLMMARTKVPSDYDFYLKFDSDMQVLSDKFLSGLVEVAKIPENIGIVVPRVEGVPNEPEFRPSNFQFFDGHVILLKPFSPWGSCMLMRRKIFLSYAEPKMLAVGDENYGIDSRLKNYNQKLGNLTAIVMDLGVYQIDNEWGQRKKNPFYFQEKRGRRTRLDRILPDLIRLSGEIAPLHVDSEVLENLWRLSSNYKELKANTYRYLLGMLDLSRTQEESNENMKTITVYKIVSPVNYPQDPNIEHGDSIYVKEIPDWAKDNPNIEIEKEQRDVMEADDITDVEEVEKTTKEETEESEETENESLKCEACGFEAKSKAGLKAHQRAKH